MMIMMIVGPELQQLIDELMERKLINSYLE